MALDTSRKESETREAESEKTNRKISLEEHKNFVHEELQLQSSFVTGLLLDSRWRKGSLCVNHVAPFSFVLFRPFILPPTPMRLSFLVSPQANQVDSCSVLLATSDLLSRKLPLVFARLPAVTLELLFNYGITATVA